MLSDLLHRAQPGNAAVRQLVARPPWGISYADAPPLTLFTVLGGPAVLRFDERDVEPVMLAPGDIVLVRAIGRHTIADSEQTRPHYLVRGSHKEVLDPTGAINPAPSAPRTFGDGRPTVTTMVRGSYELRTDVGARLLDLLPEVATVPAGPGTAAALDLLAAEITSAQPGQDAVLHRLLDLVLVLAMRAWCTRSDVDLPTWCLALRDPLVGQALHCLHEHPARRWTVGALAAEVSVSRAALAARFAELVGEPPLTYLTGWRMAIASDLLRGTDLPVATVAQEVGYADAFAFSAAFKRSRGSSPSAWRNQARS